MPRCIGLITEVERTIVFLTRQIRKKKDCTPRTMSALAGLIENFSKLKAATAHSAAPSYEDLTSDDVPCFGEAITDDDD